jgi:hypothetical protein
VFSVSEHVFSVSEHVFSVSEHVFSGSEQVLESSKQLSKTATRSAEASRSAKGSLLSDRPRDRLLRAGGWRRGCGANQW